MADHVRGNHCADLAAKQAMRWHPIDWGQYARADDREFAACMVQKMIAEVWSDFFEADPEIRRQEANDDDELDDMTFAVERGDFEMDDVRRDASAYPKDAGTTIAAVDPMALSNKDLALHIRLSTPGYDWQQNQHLHDDTDNIIIHDIPEGIFLQKRGQQWIKGRGDINTSFAYPPHYAEPVLWWWNRLKWRRADTSERPSAPCNSSTYLEAVIDFEQATGFHIGADGACSTAWNEKARVLAYIVKSLARICNISKNGMITTLKDAVAPCTDAASLTPLGAPIMSGYGRKPVWVYPETPELVAVNVWRARNWDRTATPAGRAANARRRTFAMQWQVVRKGYAPSAAWRPKAARDLQNAIDHHSDGHPTDGSKTTMTRKAPHATTETSTAEASAAPRAAPPALRDDGNADDIMQVAKRVRKMQAVRGRSAQSTTEDTEIIVDSADLRGRAEMVGSGPPSWMRLTSGAVDARHDDDGIDPHIPLPSITRSQKRGAPITLEDDLHRGGKRARNTGMKYLDGPSTSASSSSSSTSPTVGQQRNTDGADSNEPGPRDSAGERNSKWAAADHGVRVICKACLGKKGSSRTGSLPGQGQCARCLIASYIECASCKGAVVLNEPARYLPNNPILTRLWRGAWPGARICLRCYTEFTREQAWGKV